MKKGLVRQLISFSFIAVMLLAIGLGVTRVTDRKVVTFSSKADEIAFTSNVGSIDFEPKLALRRGGDLKYYYLWRYREVKFGKGRGHYTGQCPSGGDYSGQWISSCNNGLTARAYVNPGTTPPSENIDYLTFSFNGDEHVIDSSYIWTRKVNTSFWTRKTLTEFYLKMPDGVTNTSNSGIVPTSDIEYLVYEPCGGYSVGKGDTFWYVCRDGRWNQGKLTDAWTGTVHPPTDKVPESIVYLKTKTTDPMDTDHDGWVKIIFSGPKIYFQGNINDHTNMYAEDLVDRWGKWDPAKQWMDFIISPPKTGVDIYAINYADNSNPEHLAIHQNQYWLANNDTWKFRSWDSGPDSWMARNVELVDNTATDRKYYLFYDAYRPDSRNEYFHWQTAVASSASLDGPWQKLGYLGYVGTRQWWDKIGAVAPRIYKKDSAYYQFYLAVNAETKDLWKIPLSWGSENEKEVEPATYSLGLARSSSIVGPWIKTRVVGVNNNNGTSGVDCRNQGCLMSRGPSDTATREYASGQGTLFLPGDRGNPVCNSLYTGTSCSNTSVFIYTLMGKNPSDISQRGWGQGAIYTNSANLAGPWYRLPVRSGGSEFIRDLIMPPIEYDIENNDIIYNSGSRMWVMFGNHKDTANWRNTCKSGSCGIGVFWTYDFRNWKADNSAVLYKPVLPVKNEDLSSYLRNNESGINGGVGLPAVMLKNGKIYLYFDAQGYHTSGSESLMPVDRVPVSLYYSEANSSADLWLMNHLFKDIYYTRITSSAN